mgnify:CR=1 FL=1
MAVAAKPEISKILLDLGIEPVDVYAVDNAEKTYISALVEGINTLEVANKGESTRSRILRDELKRVRERKRKVKADKLFAKTSIVPVNKIKPQAFLPGSADSADKKTGGFSALTNAVNGIINILKLGNKQDKKEFEADNKERQKERREKRENALEAGAGALKATATMGKKIVSTLISPFRKIWDNITNFLKVVVAGFLFNKIFNWFLDPENKRKVESLGRFLKDYWPALATFGALFLTPLGGIIKGLLTFVGWAVPWLAKLILKNPLLAGGVIIGGFTIDRILKKMEEDQDAITQEFEQRRNAGESITREQVQDEYFKNNRDVMSLISEKFTNNMVNPLGRLFEEGGFVQGPSHNKGGVDINVEGGEYIVNKKRTGILKPILDWLNFGDLSHPPVKTTPMGFPSVGDKRIIDLLIQFLKSANPKPQSTPMTARGQGGKTKGVSQSPSISMSMGSMKMPKLPSRVSPPPPPSSSGNVTIVNEREVLPPITQQATRQGNGGKTLPTFTIATSSSQRQYNLSAMEIG